MRTLTSLMGNSQRLDGGAMFGNAPKAVWSRWVAVDEHNRIDLACRALLIEDAGQRILLETGIGAFFDPKLKERYGVVETRHVLLDSLAEHGVSDADIDVVILSHLHFDHAGGLLAPWEGSGEYRLLFPKARYVVGRKAWARAEQPHPRDKASFVPELNRLLAASGRLVLVEAGETLDCLGKDYRFSVSHGHTPGMLLTEVAMPDGPVVFAADLIPAVPWVHLPITMGYDRYPELLIDEKRALLERLLACSGRLFFTHDPATALARVSCDESGRFGVSEAQAELVALAR